jgi:hypothetical protein
MYRDATEELNRAEVVRVVNRWLDPWDEDEDDEEYNQS